MNLCNKSDQFFSNALTLMHKKTFLIPIVYFVLTDTEFGVGKSELFTVQ